MKKMTVREFDRLPVIYDNEYFVGIKGLKIGDYYLIQEREDEIQKGDIVTAYKVINKKNERNIESVFVQVEIV